MAQSLSNILLHLVFSTKHRKPWINKDIESELKAYLATICQTLKCPTHSIGCNDDHIHVACSLARTISVSKLIQELKQVSFKWMKTYGKQYRVFAWQYGFGAFSIGQSQLEDLRSYLENQREHHRQLSFQDEFRRICEKYLVPIDERYVWD